MTEKNMGAQTLETPSVTVEKTKPVDSENVQQEEYSIILPSNKRPTRKPVTIDEAEPLIDTTAPIPLNSKKTKRREERLNKKKHKKDVRSKATNLLELPAELLLEVISHLPPSDVFTLLRLNHEIQDFVLDNEPAIARSINQIRYSVLSQCFPLPILSTELDAATRTALQHSKRQELLNTLRKPYQHIPPIDASRFCTCTSCIFAWNNLCLILDLAHFQPQLDAQQPIPMIARGTAPEWNARLLAATAQIVQRATHSPLTYSAILQKHLHTITGTLQRHSKMHLRAPTAAVQKQQRNAARTLTSPKTLPQTAMRPTRVLYQMTIRDAAEQTDGFLERCGPPSWEPPFHRDNYYSLQAYVPNRRWAFEEGGSGGGWRYYGMQHVKDVAWVRARFRPEGEEQGEETRRDEMLRAFREAVYEGEGGSGGERARV